MNITITGNLGAGKSSVCKEFEKQGFTIITGGSIFRDIAQEMGISVEELNRKVNAGEIKGIDNKIDTRTTELSKQMDNVVFDSRLAWNFAAESFKVFLIIDPQIAAERVYQGNDRNAEHYASLDDAVKGLKRRADLEQERFLDMYNIDYYDASNYDLIIESSYATPQQIAKEILDNFERYKMGNYQRRVELNLRGMYPTQSFRDFNSDTINKYYEEEKTNDSLCAQEGPYIAVHNGYNYILDGHHHAFAALVAGKVFTDVSESIANKYNEKDICNIPKKELYDFEDLGKFQYHYYPEDIPVKEGYHLDFTRFADDRQNDLELSEMEI